MCGVLLQRVRTVFGQFSQLSRLRSPLSLLEVVAAKLKLGLLFEADGYARIAYTAVAVAR